MIMLTNAPTRNNKPHRPHHYTEEELNDVLFRVVQEDHPITHAGLMLAATHWDWDDWSLRSADGVHSVGLLRIRKTKHGWEAEDWGKVIKVKTIGDINKLIARN